MGGTPDSVAYSTQKYYLLFPGWYRTPLQGSPAAWYLVPLCQGALGVMKSTAVTVSALLVLLLPINQ